MSAMMYERLWQALLDTIAMVGISSLIALRQAFRWRCSWCLPSLAG